jgi:hypothetical protein
MAFPKSINRLFLANKTDVLSMAYERITGTKLACAASYEGSACNVCGRDAQTSATEYSAVTVYVPHVFATFAVPACQLCFRV